MAPADLCNGERFVVLMFLSRILFSAPASLFYEALALGVLAMMAFLVEISVEASDSAAERFKTRRGASSGILLGAITLPAVMFSRSIQLHRSQDLEGVKIHDIESILLLYWTSIASCLGVIISLVFSLRISSPWKIYIKGKIGLLCIASSMIFCFLSLKFSQNVVMMWLITHALACSTLVYHMLRTFPSCASIGEALLASSGLVIYFGNMMGYTLSKMEIFSETFNFIHGSQTPISTFLQGVLLGLLLFPLFYKFLLQICNKSKFLPDLNDVGRSIIFFGSLTMLATIVVHLQMKSSLPWLFEFVLADLGKRVLLSSYWISIIGFSVVRFYKISKKSKIERILLRKYYHLVAVLMFLPALLYQPEFLDLSFGAALAVFLMLEIIRVWRIWPLGHLVHEFMNAFTDHRDSDLLIVSHFSLLLGCALPKWLTAEANDRPLAPYAGILSLGIGDTMASVVGHKYGVLRWSKTGKKTVEGTAAGITSVLLTSSVLLPHLASSGYVLSQHWWALLSAVIVSGLLEAYTAQLDNAFIPLVFFSLLCL